MSTLTNAEKIRKLPWLYAGQAANSVFCYLTVFGSIFVLFLNELGLQKAQIGSLLSLLPFAGVISLFVAPAAAEHGFRRTFLTAFFLRKFVIALLLFTPLIVRVSAGLAFTFVFWILLIFALCRAVGETAYYPWAQELIPDALRGRVSALNGFLATLAAMAAVGAGSLVVGGGAGLDRYVFLIAAGVAAGFLGVWCFRHLSGGEPGPAGRAGASYVREVLAVLKDRNCLLFFVVLMLITCESSLVAFVPLYMKEQIGLSVGQIVFLDVIVSLGGLATGYLWGWSSDRYGSRPVMFTCLYLLLLLPIGWFLMPRDGLWSGPAAFALAFFLGVASTGWVVGWTRHLYISIAPAEKNVSYLAVFYAWSGLAGGLGPLLAGGLLDTCQGLSASTPLGHVDAYTPLFGVSFILAGAGILALSRVKADTAMSTTRFLGMFLQGNPLSGFWSMMRFRYAADEEERVATTARMGEARNPLSVHELIEALHDPSFNVRYEAILSVARMRPEEALIDALIGLLGDRESDIGVTAAWALGKLGDRRAVLPLRLTLISGEPLLQARSARSLGMLDDVESIPALKEKLMSDPHESVRIACAAALGFLRAETAAAGILELLRTVSEESGREEVALALARIVGGERYYTRLWRDLRGDRDTAAAQAVFALARPAADASGTGAAGAVERCAQYLARGDWTQARPFLAELAGSFRPGAAELPGSVLDECRSHFESSGPLRSEYFALAMHVLHHVLK